MTAEQGKTQEQPVKLILLAYNDTEQSKRAFDKSLHLAKDNNAALLGVMWETPRFKVGGNSFFNDFAMLRTVGEANKILSLARLEDATKKLGIRAAIGVEISNDKDKTKFGMTVVSYANDQGVDVIIMGDGKPVDERKKGYVNLADIVEQNASCKVIRVK